MKPIGKFRILLLNENTYRRFWWFEMRGDDLYWGPSSKGFDTPPISFSGETATISIPETIKSFEKSSMKASYHKSGEFHIKKISTTGLEQTSDKMRWRAKDKIAEPFRFCTVITKPMSFYEEHTSSLTKDRAIAIAYRIPTQFLNCRHYFEFFISREGEYPWPEPLLKMPTPVKDELNCYSFNFEYILVIRDLRFPQNHSLNNFHPSVEFSFFCEEKEMEF